MKILSVNSGSSSLKFELFKMPQESSCIVGLVERIGQSGAQDTVTLKYDGKKFKKTLAVKNHSEAVSVVLTALIETGAITSVSDLAGVGHRVVHGGEVFSHSVEINPAVLQVLEDLSCLAPLHNPVNLVGIHAFMDAVPHARHVAVFDTAFHQTMKPQDYIYPIPYAYYETHKIRRYGFHGTSHYYVSRRFCELTQKDVKQTNIISLHLGNGASITAIHNGKSITTSMGFTPLAGIMMGTRSGDIDPAIVTFLMEREGLSSDAVLDILNRESGMLGVSQLSSDARDILDASAAGNNLATLTLDIYVNRVIETVGAYFVKLGHLDGIVFTGGIGENSGTIRSRILEGLKEALHLDYDDTLNNRVLGVEANLSTEHSAVAVWVIPTQEELVIARDTVRFLDKAT